MTKTAALSDVLARIDADFDESLTRLFGLLPDQVDFSLTRLSLKIAARRRIILRLILPASVLRPTVRPTAGHPAIVGKSNGAGGGSRFVLWAL